MLITSKKVKFVTSSVSKQISHDICNAYKLILSFKSDCANKNFSIFKTFGMDLDLRSPKGTTNQYQSMHMVYE